MTKKEKERERDKKRESFHHQKRRETHSNVAAESLVLVVVGYRVRGLVARRRLIKLLAFFPNKELS